MKLYNYDAYNSEFLGVSEARESPLEPGVYLVPAYATTIEPPTIVEGKVGLFIDGAWVIQDMPPPPVEEVIPEVEDATPLERLRRFLITNPDVAALLEE